MKSSKLRKLCMGTMVLGVGLGINARADVPTSDSTRPVELTLIATDHNGKPVTDLNASELKVVDDSSPQQISRLAALPQTEAEAMVILLDVLDFSVTERGVVALRLKAALTQIPASAQTYLYVVDPNGKIVPIIPISDKTDKIQQAGPLLDQALGGFAATKRIDLTEFPTNLFKTRYDALLEMGRQMAPLPGRKQLLWITYGLPSSVAVIGGRQDLGLALRNMAAHYNGVNIAIYSVDPGLRAATLGADGLDILTAATGGRAFQSSDIGAAVTQARADGMSSYVLQYQPTAGGKSKSDVHRVRVTCERKGVRLVTQQVYLSNPAH